MSFLTSSKKNAIEVERERFEHMQAASLQKAINSTESPVKEKHSRNAVLASFEDRGGGLFWSLVSRLPLQADQVVCWKFCHVLHRLLREGHAQVIPDSVKWIDRLTELGKLWAHLREGFGPLNDAYVRLLVQRLKFHKKNPEIPGSLHLSEANADKLVTKADVNVQFEVVLDMMDYIDEILNMGKKVFQSIDSSRLNSMTVQGQCRLAPLIFCIQDSCLLYDYMVRLMFELHRKIPADSLSDHRRRFATIFTELKSFYEKLSVMQYFKNLVQIPSLADKCPDFLSYANLQKHQTPVVVVREEPSPVPSEPSQPPPPAPSVVDPFLVDLSMPAPPPLVQSQAFNVFSNDSFVPPPKVEPLHKNGTGNQREKVMIEELTASMRDLETRLEFAINEISGRDAHIEELSNERQRLLFELENLRNELEQMRKQLEAAERVKQEAVQAVELKFQKLKDLHKKLTDEHVALLRQHGEMKKTLASTQNNAKQLEAKLTELVRQRETHEEVFKQGSEQTAALQTVISSLEGRNTELAGQVNSLEVNSRQISTRLRAWPDQVVSLFASEAVKDIQISLSQISPEAAPNGLTCPPSYLQTCLVNFVSRIDEFRIHAEAYTTGERENFWQPFSSAIHAFGRDTCALIVALKCVSNSDVDLADALAASAATLAGQTTIVLQSVADKDISAALNALETCKLSASEATVNADRLMPRSKDIRQEDLSDLLEQEMQTMHEAIDAASSKIEEMLDRSRESATGVRLEVNERILDACTQLMLAVRQMIISSRDLQREITSHEYVGSTTEYYNRNSKWTEGLISASKSVGSAANGLVKSADGAISRDGRLEELIVWSQEIAASTVQLVCASRVKAPNESTKLPPLLTASRGVSQSTAAVVGQVKACIRLLDEQDTLSELSKLSLHDTKRREMESQVRVLELESTLTKERERLAALRRQHYQMAGEDLDESNSSGKK